MSALDAIVLGAGGVGAAALYHLAKRGRRVLGVDRFLPGHARGSSHGETRVIRLAYFEHPDYVPLLRRSYELWEELEERCGRTLYHETGLVEIGPKDGVVVPGVLASARLHGLAVEELSRAECHRRFPGLAIPDGSEAVFERRAGYLEVEECVRAHASAAVELGAQLAIGPAVQSWRALPGGGVEVVTDRGRHTADTLVIAPGAWAGSLLPGVSVPFAVRRKPLFWFTCEDPRLAESAGCPVYLYETPAGVYYGFPSRTGSGTIKVAEHSGGEPVADPVDVDRSVHADDEARVRTFLKAHLPSVTGARTGHAVCLYTLTPDENFVVDRHPGAPGVVFAAGLSGHGFKFTSVLGEVLADLAMGVEPGTPIAFLNQRRGADK